MGVCVYRRSYLLWPPVILIANIPGTEYYLGVHLAVYVIRLKGVTVASKNPADTLLRAQRFSPRVDIANTVR